MTPFEFYRDALITLPSRLAQWRSELAAASIASGVDAYLLAAVMDRETNGKNILGDYGHGHGLMQIDDRSHASFVKATLDTGAPLWSEPAFNVLYGAELLARNLFIFRGDTWAAVAAYNAGPGNVKKALAKLALSSSSVDRLAACDSVTTLKNYASDVKRRRDGFVAHSPSRTP